jgi:hypothetical protein
LHHRLVTQNSKPTSQTNNSTNKRSRKN